MIDNQDVANKQQSSFDQKFHIFLILSNKIASTSKVHGQRPKGILSNLDKSPLDAHCHWISSNHGQFLSPQTNMPYSYSNIIIWGRVEFKIL